MSRRDKAEPKPPGTRVRATLHTLSWLGISTAMGYAGAAQGNGAAYLMAFFTGALGLLSYLYARANLRHLEIRVGAVPVSRAGGGEWLQVELRAGSGHSASSIEMLIVGSARTEFVEMIPSGQMVQVALKVPDNGSEMQVLLRSSYPLGLLQSERVVTVKMDRPSLPAPAGSLPLPPLVKTQGSSAGKQGSHGPGGREGDDFAGVREWQPGDSMRQVDWRAVARGRPLLVKTWSSAGAEAVLLDWNVLTAEAPADRVAQMLKWIRQCEQQGLAYALKLPQAEIPAGQGEPHRQRCLAALAELHATGLSSQEKRQKQRRIPAGHEHTAGLPAGPLRMLAATLFVAALMLQSIVPVPVLGLFFLCLCCRCLLPQPLRTRWIPMLVVMAGLAGLFAMLGPDLTMESGISVLVILAGGKMLESRSPHDFQVMAMIGWFFCLCGVLTDQAMGRAIWMFLCFAVTTGCMIRFRRGAAGAAAPARMSAKLLLQALPLVLLLFLFFPRVSLDYLARLGVDRTAVTGVGSSLDPGKVAEIAKSNEVAFRVEFPDGVIPPNNLRYWRCVVLWGSQGLSWSRGVGSSYAPVNAAPEPGDVVQQVTLEPHGQSWLPGLDYPVHASDGRATFPLSTERLLSTHDRVRKVKRFRVLSRPGLSLAPLSEDHEVLARQVPESLSPALRTLAAEWKKAGSDEQIVQTALQYFRAQGFKYTLEPGNYQGPGALEDFMLRRRVGFCEHFSAAFATLMRAAGVPSRIVMGYLGGEMSITGTHMIVRQSDAHSWTEVWLENKGWTRIDPTAVLAPERVDANLETFLLGTGDGMDRQRSDWLVQAWDQTQELWDQLNYQWLQAVVSFDEDSQFGLLSFIGASGLKGHHLLLISLGAIFLAAATWAWWLRRPAKDSDAWRQAWEKACRQLERRGHPARRASEGPLHYAARLGAGAEVSNLATLYAHGRYGGGTQAELRAFREAVRQLVKA